MALNLLDPSTQDRFTQPLARPIVTDARRGGRYQLAAKQRSVQLGLHDPLSGQPLVTALWGFEANRLSGGHSRPAPSPAIGAAPTLLLTRSGRPIQVRWANALPTDLPGGHLLPLDSTLLQSMLDGMAGHHVQGQSLIPMVVHLHGGHNEWTSDGYPTNWITQDPTVKGSPTQPVFYRYGQSQQGSTLWFHDHAMGDTRLNTYAGLNGAYVIEDKNSKRLIADGYLPRTLASFDSVLMLQDRAFTASGDLYFPGAHPDDPIPGTFDASTGTSQTVADELAPDYVERGGKYPTAMPEFFGDFVMVNGGYAPFATVEQSDYVYRLVNSSDSRFYVLQFDDPNVRAVLLGGDGGLLRQAQTIFDGDGLQEDGERLVLAPGERVELLLDFSKLAVGEKVHLLNTGPAFEPFKGFAADGSLNTGDAPSAAEPGATSANPGAGILEFRVSDQLATGQEFHSRLTENTVLNPDVGQSNPVVNRTRRIALFEGEDGSARIHPLLGSAEDVRSVMGEPVKAGPVVWDAPATEAPTAGDTEIWQVFNNTEDAHPLHLHPIQFQVMGRYEISAVDADGDGYLNDLGASLPLFPEDSGAQDTVWIAPGQALQLKVTWDLAGSYVYHCHILSHEDHTMMRPLDVINPVVGTSRPDRLKGTADADQIRPLGSDDVAIAGFGDDHFLASRNDGDDVYDGGQGVDGYDCTRINAAVLIDLQASGGRVGVASGPEIGKDALVSIENIVGGGGDDSITGSDRANVLVGGLGADHLRGLGGKDRITGGLGDDWMSGGRDTDTFVFLREPGQKELRLGADVIADFEMSADQSDQLLLDSRLYSDLDAMIAAGGLAQQGDDLVIRYGADSSITLLGVSLNGFLAHAPQCLSFV